MSDTTDRIKRCLVQALDMPIPPEEIHDDAELMGLEIGNGGTLDSLAALEIVVAMSAEFNLPLDDVPREAFQSVSALGAFIESALQTVQHGQPA